MIVFGHNNFIVKSYTPQQVGINEQDAQGIRFEIRERYAHLFWIPFFPIGKLWTLKRAGDDNLYEMPLEIKQYIKSRYGTPGTKWYSFILPIIGIVIGLFALLNNAIEDQNYEDRLYNEYEESKMLVSYPTTGDCYVLKYYENKDGWVKNDIILKVKRYDKSSIQFISLYEDLYAETKSEDRYAYHKSFDIAETYNHNPTYIDKKSLISALNNKATYTKKPIKLKPLKGYYVLDQIDRRDLDDY